MGIDTTTTVRSSASTMTGKRPREDEESGISALARTILAASDVESPDSSMDSRSSSPPPALRRRGEVDEVPVVSSPKARERIPFQTPPRTRSALHAVSRVYDSPSASDEVDRGIADIAQLPSPERQHHGSRLRRQVQKVAETIAGIASPPRSQSGAASGGGANPFSPERPPKADSRYHDGIHHVLTSPIGAPLRAIHEELSRAGIPSLSSPVHASHVLKPVSGKRKIKGFHYCQQGSIEASQLSEKKENPENGVYLALFKDGAGKKKWSTFFPQTIPSEAKLLELFAERKFISSTANHYLYTFSNGLYVICISNDGMLTFDTMYPLYHVTESYIPGADLTIRFQTKSSLKTVTVTHRDLMTKLEHAVTWDLDHRNEHYFFVTSPETGKEELLVDISYKLKKGDVIPGIWVKIPLSLLPLPLQARVKAERIK